MSTLTAIFLIAALGYMVGSINLAGLKLGASGILLVALAFGHFGVVVPSVIKDLGLALFVGSVGFIAGPGFMDNFKGQAAPSLMLGPIIISLGSLMTAGAIKLFNLPAPLAIGMMTGALTSTPGLAAASEATGSELASIGFGIAYPFGVLGIVLFVQLVPKLLRVDMEAERNLLIGRCPPFGKDDAAPDKAVKPKGLGLAAYCTPWCWACLSPASPSHCPGRCIQAGHLGRAASGRTAVWTYWPNWRRFAAGAAQGAGTAAGDGANALSCRGRYRGRTGLCGGCARARHRAVSRGPPLRWCRCLPVTS